MRPHKQGWTKMDHLKHWWSRLDGADIFLICWMAMIFVIAIGIIIGTIGVVDQTTQFQQACLVSKGSPQYNGVFWVCIK